MASSLIQLSDGSYIIHGGVALLKTDSNGNQLWIHYYGQFGSLIQTNDSGYLLAGDKATQGLAKNQDLWFVKTDANGVQEWTVTHGGSGDQRLNSIIQLSDGSLVIAGTSGSEAWLFKAQVVEDIATSGTPGFELGVLILNLSLLFLILRKRRQ
jgi:hypothetical protein